MRGGTPHTTAPERTTNGAASPSSKDAKRRISIPLCNVLRPPATLLIGDLRKGCETRAVAETPRRALIRDLIKQPPMPRWPSNGHLGDQSMHLCYCCGPRAKDAFNNSTIGCPDLERGTASSCTTALPQVHARTRLGRCRMAAMVLLPAPCNKPHVVPHAGSSALQRPMA